MFRRSKIKHTPKLPTSSSKPVIQLNNNNNSNSSGTNIATPISNGNGTSTTINDSSSSSCHDIPSTPVQVVPIVTSPNKIGTTIVPVVAEKPNIISNESQCEPMQLDYGDNISPIISSSTIPISSPQSQLQPIQSSTTTVATTTSTYLSTPLSQSTVYSGSESSVVVVVDTGPPSVSIPIEVNNNTIPNNQFTDPPRSSSLSSTTPIKPPQAKCQADKSVPPTHPVSSSPHTVTQQQPQRHVTSSPPPPTTSTSKAQSSSSPSSSASSSSSTSCVSSVKDVIDHDKRTISYLIRNPISSNRRGRKRIKKIADKTTKPSPPSDDDGENSNCTSTSTSTTCSSNKKHGTNGSSNHSGKDRVNPSSPSSSTTSELNVSNHDTTNSQQSQTKSVGPRVKVAPDGSIVLDEESLVIKKPKDVRETIVENSLNGKVTYSSFREKPRTARWTKDETLKFYTALKLIGPDFSIMAKLFFSGTRSRTDLKNKFRRETKLNKSVIENTLYEVGHDYGLAQEAFENELFS